MNKKEAASYLCDGCVLLIGMDENPSISDYITKMEYELDSIKHSLAFNRTNAALDTVRALGSIVVDCIVNATDEPLRSWKRRRSLDYYNYGEDKELMDELCNDPDKIYKLLLDNRKYLALIKELGYLLGAINNITNK